MSDPVAGNVPDERRPLRLADPLPPWVPPVRVVWEGTNVPDELIEMAAKELYRIDGYNAWEHELESERAAYQRRARQSLAVVLPVVRRQVAAEIRARAIEEYAPGTTDRALIMYWADRVVRGDP